MIAPTERLLLSLLLAGYPLASGAISFRADLNRVSISDFPQAAPCTPARVWQADRLHGWGKVTYDPATDTYTVDADLHIGSNEGTHTYFQIGSPSHPREALHVRGNVVVQPDWVQGENEGNRWWLVKRRFVNRLTLGDPDDPSVRAALRLASSSEARRNLAIGSLRANAHGGQLHVYHSMIGAITPDPEHRLGHVVMVGNSIVLRDTAISRVAGVMTTGAGPGPKRTYSIENVRFEHGGVGIGNGTQRHTGSVFRDLDIAVRDYGCLDAVLTNCRFEGNRRNWSLKYSDKGLTCIDCSWTTPTEGDEYQAWTHRKTGKRQYPSFVSRRHIAVAVVDHADQPVPGANVQVRCEQSDAAHLVTHPRQVTDALGRTPSQGQSRAILLTETVIRATDTPNQPSVTHYRYAIIATASGYEPTRVEAFAPQHSWQVVTLKLRKTP